LDNEYFVSLNPVIDGRMPSEYSAYYSEVITASGLNLRDFLACPVKKWKTARFGGKTNNNKQYSTLQVSSIKKKERVEKPLVFSYNFLQKEWQMLWVGSVSYFFYIIYNYRTISSYLHENNFFKYLANFSHRGF